MKHSYFLFSLVLLFGLSLNLTGSQVPLAFAEEEVTTYQPGVVIGDGRSGRVFRKWSKVVQDPRRIKRVELTLRLKEGSEKTYVNLRFGEYGDAFEQGKRAYFTNGKLLTTSFLVGEPSRTRPLVLNVYEGEVYVAEVRAFFDPVHSPVGSGTTQELEPGDSFGHETQAEKAALDCDRRNLKRPRIEIARVRKSGGLFSGKYRIDGEVFGACIEEAGYYERGKLEKRFFIPLSDRHQRYEFELQVRSGRSGQIRAYTSDGRVERVYIDEVIKDSGSL